MKFLITVNIFLFISFSAQAFTLNNAAGANFSQNEVKINVEGSSPCSNIDLTNEELLDVAAEGMDQYWNRAPTSRLHISKGSVIHLSSNFHTEAICTAGTNCTPNPLIVVPSDILISCNSNATDFNSTSILGVTLPNNVTGRTISGALILLNDKVGSQFRTKTRHEKMTIIAHEVGHALGLGHSKIVDSLMYYSHNPNRNYLSEDDMDGITFLYPAEQPKIASCGTISLDKNGPQKGLLFFIMNLLAGLIVGLTFSKFCVKIIRFYLCTKI